MQSNPFESTDPVRLRPHSAKRPLFSNSKMYLESHLPHLVLLYNLTLAKCCVPTLMPVVLASSVATFVTSFRHNRKDTLQYRGVDTRVTADRVNIIRCAGRLCHRHCQISESATQGSVR